VTAAKEVRPDGHVGTRLAGPRKAPDTLAPAVRAALEELERRLGGREFTVPTEEDLAALGLAGRGGRHVVTGR
jgi:hypothetical protein